MCYWESGLSNLSANATAKKNSNIISSGAMAKIHSQLYGYEYEQKSTVAHDKKIGKIKLEIKHNTINVVVEVPSG